MLRQVYSNFRYNKILINEINKLTNFSSLKL